jgi:hypothetical protein
VDYCFGEHILPQQETAFYISGEKKRLYWRFWISPAVNSRNRGKSLSRPCIHGAKRTYTSVFMQLQGKDLMAGRLLPIAMQYLRVC